MLLSRAIAHVESANFPVAYCGLKIITSLSLRFPDFQRLPIGSGEIESAHRYVVQHRFKLAGAWWKSENIDYMLSLQLNRANDFWDDYWDNLAAIAA